MKAHIREDAVPLDSKSYVGTFKDLEQLKTITGKVNRFAVGELVYVQDEDKMYAFTGYDWKQIDAKPAEGTGLELSLFDMNEQILRQQGPLDEDGIQNATDILLDYISFSPIGKYYMLLNHKKSYYTVFNITEESWQFDSFAEAVLSCCNDLGVIYSVSRTEDNQAIEIWVCDPDDTMHCLYLFNYDKGIVKVKR